ncbi:MAG: DNA cytosine methyltransferase [Planctomycetota bacterium]
MSRGELLGLALCSGIGGLELGVSLASGGASRTVCYVEREAYAAACLVARMEDEALDSAPVADDLKAFDGRPWRGVVDLVSAGYPCQPFSNAGRQRGAQDERHLWPDVARVLGEVGPRVVVLENVPGHLRVGFDAVLGDLASLGFDAEWGVFSAAEVGAPHHRDRLFVLAWRVSEASRDALRLFAERGQSPPRSAEPWHTEPGDLGENVADTARVGWPEGRPESEGRARGTSVGERGAELADAGSSRRPAPSSGSCEQAARELVPRSDNLGDPPRCRNAGGLHGRSGQARGSAEADPERARRERAAEAGALPLWPPGPHERESWARLPAEAQPAVCGVAHGAALRMDRLRALGNGVVPLAAANAIRTLASRALGGVA